MVILAAVYQYTKYFATSESITIAALFIHPYSILFYSIPCQGMAFVKTINESVKIYLLTYILRLWWVLCNVM